MNRVTLPGEAQETSEYDKVGNLVGTVNATAMQTGYQYDALNRLLAVTEAGVASAGYAYDGHDNISQVTDAKGQATSFTYDDFGRRLTRTAPDTGFSGYEYDAAGNVAAVTDAKGQVMTLAYDAMNRPVSQSYSGTGGDVLFAYDQGANGIGRLSRITDREGTDAFAYDSAGRIASETRVIGAASHVIGYSWDGATDELAGMTYPSGLNLSYVRDGGGRISAIKANGAPLVSTASHLPFGPLQTATLGAVALVRSYDQRYNVARIKAGSLDYTYTRDGGGHVTGIAGVQTPTVATDQSDYSYNPANNQLTGTTGAAAKAPAYDAGGNMVADGTLVFAYDGLNRLIRVEKAGATVATYGYDSANRRISKTIAGVTTHYLYDLSSQLIAETQADGTVLREYIYLDGEPLVLKEYQTNPGTYYFINDHLGTPQQLVTATGTIVWQAAYLPFGQAQIKTATVANNLRFPGQYFDAETELHYNWNRYYDPDTGRYISADPIGLAGGMNLYAYVGENPINKTDPEGLSSGICCKTCNNTVGVNVLRQLKISNIDGSSAQSDLAGGNGFRHCLATCQATKACGEECAKDFWDGRENPSSGAGQQDLVNNQVGYGVANSGEGCWDGCMNAWKSMKLDCKGRPCPAPLLTKPLPSTEPYPYGP